MPSNKTGVFRSTNFFGKKRKFYVVKRGNYFMVKIHSSVAKQHISLNSWFRVFINYFFWNKMEHEWISVIWWIFRGFFSKNADGSKRFLMVFWSASKKWIYIIDQEMKSGFWSTGSELFLADRQGEDCCNGSFVIVGWWIMLWKRRVSDVPFVISETSEVSIHRHSARSEA